MVNTQQIPCIHLLELTGSRPRSEAAGVSEMCVCGTVAVAVLTM